MSDLPHVDITGGLDSGEFVRRLRGGDADDMRQAVHVLLDALYASVTESYEDQKPRRLTWPIFTWSAGGPKGWNFDEPIDSALCEALHVLADVVGWMPPEKRPEREGAG